MSFFTALSKIVATTRRYVKRFVTHSLDISAMIYRKIPLFCTALYLNVINSVYIWISIYIFLSMNEHVFPLLFHCFQSLITISLFLAPFSVLKPHPIFLCLTLGRSVRSATLFVGSTPWTRMNVKSSCLYLKARFARKLHTVMGLEVERALRFYLNELTFRGGTHKQRK